MKIFKKLLGTFLVVLMVFTSIPLQGFMGLNFKDMISFKAEAASSASTSAVEFNGHYYKVYEIDKLWNDAKTYCESVGGYLATVTSKEENEFLMSIIGDYYCFLGGTDIESENVWKWVTGETWSYTNWMTGEPNNGDNVNEGQDFLTIYGSNGDAGTYGKWDDGWNEKHYFVCEWDFSPDLNDNPTSGFLSSGDFAIGTSDDLVELARLVNKEKQDFAGKKIVLLNSIDLTGIELEPIGSSSSTPFKGSFDGNGYTISGIKITTSRDQNGLFGYVYSDDSVFSNVTLSGSISNGLYSGGLIGNLKVPKKGNFKVQNIINKCSVRCQDTWNDNITAGVIGCINSYGNANIEIIGCINSGSITSAAGLADSYTGGIVSCIYAAKTDYYKFYRCLHNGSLSSSAPKGYYDGYAGGIVAYMSNGNYIVDECMASGRVYCLGYDTHSGGLIGKMTPHSFEIKNCVLTSNVTGKCSSGDAEASCTVGGCYEDNYDDNSVWEFENILVSGQITDTYGQAALVINDERDGASLKKISVNNCFFNTSKLNIPTDRFLAWTALLSGTNTITTKVANSQGYSYNTLKTNKRLYSAWNFSEVWEFGEDGLPRLRCFGSMKNVLQSDGTIRLQALAYNKNKELVQVGNANLTLWLGDTQIGKTLTPDGDGYFSINVDELYKENPKILLDNVKVHVEALIEDNIRGVNGNGLYLLSDYDFGEESLNYYLNNSGDIILDNKQLRIDMLSIAYTTRLANNVDVKTVCSDFMSKLYKMTGGRINIKQMKTTEYLTHVGVNNSNANILAYYDYEKSCANLDGYWSGGHIWMSQTYSDGFTSGVLCHEALHYILGVRDEYCCGYRIEGNSYDFDFDCDGEIYEDDYDIYYVADNIETEGGEKITNKYINLLIDSSKETIEIQPSFKKLDLTIDDLKNGNIFQYKNSYDLSDYFCDNSVYISTILEKNGTNFGFIFSYPLSNGDSFGIMESNYDGELFMSDASTYRYIDQSMKDNKREYAHKFTAQYYDTEYDNEFLSVTQKLDKVLEGVLTSNTG